MLVKEITPIIHYLKIQKVIQDIEELHKSKKWDGITQIGSRNRGSHFRNEE